jgi:zinc protease
MFYIVAMPRPGVKTEELEKGIYDEIDAVQKSGVTDRELDKARRQFRRSQIQTRQSSLSTAMRLGQYTVYFDDPNLISTIVDKFDAVTADQVKQAAQKYLVAKDRTVVTTLPAARSAEQAAAGR